MNWLMNTGKLVHEDYYVASRFRTIYTGTLYVERQGKGKSKRDEKTEEKRNQEIHGT